MEKCKKCDYIIEWEQRTPYWYCIPCVTLLLDSIQEKELATQDAPKGDKTTDVDSLAERIESITEYIIRDWDKELRRLLSKVWYTRPKISEADISHWIETEPKFTLSPWETNDAIEKRKYMMFACLKHLLKENNLLADE